MLVDADALQAHLRLQLSSSLVLFMFACELGGSSPHFKQVQNFSFSPPLPRSV